MLRNFVQNVKNTKWTSILSCYGHFPLDPNLLAIKPQMPIEQTF